MDIEYGSQGCLMEQRQIRVLNLMEYWGLLGPFNVCLSLFEDWNTKNKKLAKMPLYREKGVWHQQNVDFCQKQRLFIFDILVVVIYKMYF